MKFGQILKEISLETARNYAKNVVLRKTFIWMLRFMFNTIVTAKVGFQLSLLFTTGMPI